MNNFNAFSVGCHGPHYVHERVIGTQELYRLGCQVWHFLGPLQLVEASPVPQPYHNLQHYVRVSMGASGLSFLLGVDAAVAIALAAAMFDCPADALTAADIRDALGEAANMLAGKIAEQSGAPEGLGLPEHLLAPRLRAYLQQIEIITESGALSAGHMVYLAINRDPAATLGEDI